ncbi:hypothetical protein D3C73_574970 [compost metagenome]
MVEYGRTPRLPPRPGPRHPSVRFRNEGHIDDHRQGPPPNICIPIESYRVAASRAISRGGRCGRSRAVNIDLNPGLDRPYLLDKPCRSCQRFCCFAPQTGIFRKTIRADRPLATLFDRNPFRDRAFLPADVRNGKLRLHTRQGCNQPFATRGQA